MTHREGSDNGLARVTYLPGVTPPSEPSVNSENPGVSLKAAPAGATLEQSRALEKLSQAVRLIEAQHVEPQPPAETDGERSARAHNVSMHALTRRGMSSREMTDLLTSRDLEAHDVAVEVESLKRVGLLDDVELASTLVRTLTERKGLGRSAITAELRRRKIDSHAIEAVLDVLDGDDELARATEIALKRAPQLRSLDNETAKRRLGAFLMRKGYSGSVVSSAVQTALSSHAPTSRGPRFR